MINSFKNRLTALREILEYKNKIQETRCLNFRKEEQTKKELNALKTEKDEGLELLQENIKKKQQVLVETKQNYRRNRIGRKNRKKDRWNRKIKNK